jgi:hypothetical protein
MYKILAVRQIFAHEFIPPALSDFTHYHPYAWVVVVFHAGTTHFHYDEQKYKAFNKITDKAEK